MIGQPSFGAPGLDGLSRLRYGIAARVIGGDDDNWPIRFLHLVAESARMGYANSTGWRRSTARAPRPDCAAGRTFSARGRAGSSVMRACAHTPRMLAQRLRVTPQAATRLLAILAEAGIVAEITGRKSFRTFAV